MNTKKTLLSLVAVFIISNILTTMWYMLMDEANFVSFRREEVNYGLLVANHIVFAAGFVFLFPSYYKQKPKIFKGFVYGVVMASVMFIPTGLVVRAIWQVDINTIFLLNTIAHLAIGGTMGIVTGLIYNYKNK